MPLYAPSKMCHRPFYGRILFVVASVLVLYAKCAAADEGCRYEKDNVVCNKADFALLMRTLAETKAAKELCLVRLPAETQRAEQATKRLETCQAAQPSAPIQTAGPSLDGISWPVGWFFLGLAVGGLVTLAIR